jgi:hypothetical protein
MNSDTIENQIDDIIKEHTNYRFATELQYTTNETRKEILRSILQIQQGKPILVKDDARTKLNKIYDEIDKNALKKNWVKLTTTQKQERIKEFVKRSVKDTKLSEQMELKLLKMLDDGKLKRTFIDYDTLNGSIISITIPEKLNTKTKKVIMSSSSDSDE